MTVGQRILAVGRRHRLGTAVVALVILAGGGALATAVIGATSPNGSRATAADRHGTSVLISGRPLRLNPSHKVYWGALIKDSAGQAPWSMSATTAFEHEAGKGVSIISWGSPFYSLADCKGYCDFQTPQFTAVREHGAIPLLSWAPTVPGSRQKLDAQIASGAADSYVTRWAQTAKEWGHPLFLRFAWEMNGNWFPWGVRANGNTPLEFVAMWRHVHNLFARAGATNVTWVWCPNVYAPTFHADWQLYPGNGYVDWTCLDGYNGGSPWTSFGDLYRQSYERLVGAIAKAKPVLLGEVSSTEARGSKAGWIRNMFTILPALFPRVRALVWYETRDPGPAKRTDWPIESSPSARKAFADGISNPIYTSNRYSELGSAPIPPPR